MGDERTLPVSDHDYGLLEEVTKANGWSVAEATHRAIHALWALDQQLQALQERHPGDVGELVGRLRRQLPPELLVRPKIMRKVEEELSYGKRTLRIGIDEFLFGMADGHVIASRRVPDGEGERLEIYLAHEGRLTHGSSAPYSSPPDPEGVELT